METVPAEGAPPAQRGCDTRASPFYRLLVHTSRPLARSLFRLEAQGLDRLPAVGGFVVCANQLSNLDSWALGLPLYPRQVHFMAKAELFAPGLGRVATAAGAFPVRRGLGDRRAIDHAVRLARGGAIVGIFPEGTRRAKGLRKKHRAEPHTGAARVALAARVPLVPAAIAGTDRLARVHPWRVVYGPPVELADLRDGAVRLRAREATSRLWTAIRALEQELAA